MRAITIFSYANVTSIPTYSIGHRYFPLEVSTEEKIFAEVFVHVESLQEIQEIEKGWFDILAFYV